MHGECERRSAAVAFSHGDIANDDVSRLAAAGIRGQSTVTRNRRVSKEINHIVVRVDATAAFPEISGRVAGGASGRGALIALAGRRGRAAVTDEVCNSGVIGIE